MRSKIAKNKKDALKNGARVEVTVEEIDVENCRITLSYGIESRAGKDTGSGKQGTKARKQGLQKPSSEFGELLKAAFDKKK